MYPIWHPFTTARQGALVCVKKAFGSCLELSDGREVIDAIGTWWTSVFGHSYPPLVQALETQANILDHALFGSLTHEPALLVAEQLIAILGPGKVIFSDNGSTAVEIGMKLACHLASLRGHPHRTLFASFDGGYHGDTIGVMGLQGRGLFTEPYCSLLREGLRVPFVETWIGDTTVEQREEAALASVETLLQQRGKEIIAFVFEPLLQGSAGMRMCRRSYLEAITGLMKRYEIMLIADEVLTGLGRTGTFFASSEWDILALGKSLAGGMLPLAVTFLKEELFAEFFATDAPLFHGHTFTANPIACAVAAQTLKLLKANAALFQDFEQRYGSFVQGLDSPLVRIRTMGCVFAGDLPLALPYGSRESLALRDRFLEQGVLARPLGSVVYFLPAYTISNDELGVCFKALETVTQEIMRKTR